jgi:G3E family GTPase
VFEIPNGEESAQVQAVAACLRDLGLSGRYERVLVEVAGTASATWLAQHFLADGPCHEWAHLEQIVCVVDALDYLRGGRDVEKAWWNFQNEQIAGASLVVLNKCDLLEAKDLEACRGLLAQHHPKLPVIETAYGEVPAKNWAQAAVEANLDAAFERRDALPFFELPALSNALYRTHRPFHPERFWDWYNAEHPGLLRVKGLVWLATRNLLVGGVSRTRWQNACGAAGIWWAALPREEWPEEPEALRRMQEMWHEPYGDRRQELILIGDPVLLAGMNRDLDACLLTDEEYARPVQEWAALPDPFPAWDMEG